MTSGQTPTTFFSTTFPLYKRNSFGINNIPASDLFQKVKCFIFYNIRAWFFHFQRILFLSVAGADLLSQGKHGLSCAFPAARRVVGDESGRWSRMEEKCSHRTKGASRITTQHSSLLFEHVKRHRVRSDPPKEVFPCDLSGRPSATTTLLQLSFARHEVWHSVSAKISSAL